jgi:hypothetical protein
MKLIPKTEYDSLVFQHSAGIKLEEREGGVLRLSFGSTQVHLAEDAARDFLYELTAYFAQKDLQEYEGLDEAAFQGSINELTTLSLLRTPSS